MFNPEEKNSVLPSVSSPHTFLAKVKAQLNKRIEEIDTLPAISVPSPRLLLPTVPSTPEGLEPPALPGAALETEDVEQKAIEEAMKAVLAKQDTAPRAATGRDVKASVRTDESEQETLKLAVPAVKPIEPSAAPTTPPPAALPMLRAQPLRRPYTRGAIVQKAQPPKAQRKHPLQLMRERWSQVRYKRLALVLLALILLSTLFPFVMAVGYGISTYNTYLALRSHASSGVHHLLAVKDLFTGPKAHQTSMLASTKLQQAKSDFVTAHSDFEQVQILLAHSSAIATATTYFPQARSMVATATAASRMGEDIAQIGEIATNEAMVMAPRLQQPLLGVSKTPLLTQADLTRVGSELDAVLPLLDDMQRQVPSLSLDSLPAGLISAQQKAELQQFLPLLPQIRTMLAQVRSLLTPIGWLLGVDGPRTFLVQTMDRAELRPTGGFTGQYGTLQLDGGRLLAPFSLHDIALVEYAANSPTANGVAPAAYSSWWPFANWGLRDSNLSADFPTSAQLAMHQYAAEVNQSVDGVIVFTPFLIEHILQVVGPIQIPAYNETITAQNLEDRLHYYQLDNAGIRKEELIERVEDPTQARKLFTSRVEKALMGKLQQASFATLLAVVQEALHNLQTKDLQMYFANPQLENLLIQYGDAAQIDASTTHDGVYVVQANVSASKASQYVRTSIQDTVSLDVNGGATHVMQMRLDYTQIATVYGLDTYRDYVRVYVPPSAKFLWGDGFDTGTPLCGGPFAPCAANGIYPGDELVCPTGQYQAGASAPMLNDPYTDAWHPLDTIGPPTNFTSDFSGRAMFGGYVVVPKNCTMMVTLSWYVPPIGTGPYKLLVQRQAGTFPELDLTVLPTPGDCAQLQVEGLHFDGIMTEDMSFTMPTAPANTAPAANCYPQPGV
jgi:hypothetical protein